MTPKPTLRGRIRHLTKQNTELRQQAASLRAVVATRNAIIASILEEAEGHVEISKTVSRLMREGKLQYPEFRLEPADGKDLASGFTLRGIEKDGSKSRKAAPKATRSRRLWARVKAPFLRLAGVVELSGSGRLVI